MKHLLVRLAALIPLALLLAGVNYVVDPANLFGGDTYERGVAVILKRGRHVVNVRNYDERVLQKFIINKLPARPPVLVLGSSRVMLIGESIFPKGRVYNAGVSGGVMEDLFATYYLYEERGWHPDTLVIGVDPWMLNENHGEDRWKTLAPEAALMSARLAGHDAPKNKAAARRLGRRALFAARVKRFSELASLSYFQNAVMILTGAARRPSPYRATTSLVNDDFTKHTDGTIAYDKPFRDQNTEAAAKEYITRKPVYLLGSFTELTPNNRHNLVRLVTHAQQKGSKVVFFLAPYHPLVWNYLAATPEYRQVARAEAWFRRLAQQQHIAVVGSYNPADFGLTAKDFYDGMHCRQAAVDYLFHPKP